MNKTKNKISNSVFQWLSQHWFVPGVLVIIGLDIYIVQTVKWSNPLVIEVGVLLTLSVIIPIIYLTCYRSGLRRTLIRMSGLSLLGVWLASVLIPDSYQTLLLHLVPLRYLGIAVLCVVEVKLLIMMLTFIIYQDDNEGLSKQLSEQLSEKGDLPEWYARLMAYEAAFWRRLFHWLKQLITR